MSKIAVIGSSGSVWLTLQKLIQNHPTFSHVTTLYQGLSKLSEDSWKRKIEEILDVQQVVVLCVDDEISRKIVSFANSMNSRISKILDCSSAFRIDDSFVYGLPEIYKDFPQSTNISNPWCHATGIILSLRPLVESWIISQNTPVSATSITGYSWGGTKMIDAKKKWELKTMVYSQWQNHKHIAEIKKIWLLWRKIPLSFTPILSADDFSWMITRIEFFSKISVDEIKNIFLSYYHQKKWISIFSNTPPSITLQKNARQQKIDIIVTKNEDGMVTVTAVYDNLMKWAAGTALQVLNILFGIPEETWLL